MRTSRPSIARWRTPSSNRLARPTPSVRNRFGESWKSYGSGKGSSDIGERVERLEGPPFVVEVARQRVPGEHALARERGATVRVAVADEDDRALGGKRAALAAIAAHRAPPVTEAHAPSVGRRGGEVGSAVDLDALPAGHEEAQLRPADGGGDGVLAGAQVVDPGPQPDVLTRPRRGLFRGDAQRRDLGCERLAVRVVVPLVDRRVAEVVDRSHERVADGARAVPVEDELQLEM